MLNDVKSWISQHKEWAIAIGVIGAVGVFILIHKLRNSQSAGAQTSTPVSPLQNVPIVGNGFTQGGIDGTQGSILPPVVSGGGGNNGGGSPVPPPTLVGPPVSGGGSGAPQYVTVGQNGVPNTLALIAQKFNKSVSSLIAINGPQSGVTDPNAPLYNSFVVQLY